MKSLSEYMTESFVNESILSDLKNWAQSYYAPKQEFVKDNDALKDVIHNLNSFAADLSKVSSLNQQQAKSAVLTLANYVAGCIDYAFLADDIEEWMDIVGFDMEGDEGDAATEWLASLYDAIKTGSDGRIDPMQELA